MKNKSDLIKWIENNVDLIEHYDDNQSVELLVKEFVGHYRAKELKEMSSRDLVAQLIDGIDPIDDQAIADFCQDSYFSGCTDLIEMLFNYFDGKLLDTVYERW